MCMSYCVDMKLRCTNKHISQCLRSPRFSDPVRSLQPVLRSTANSSQRSLHTRHATWLITTCPTCRNVSHCEERIQVSILSSSKIRHICHHKPIHPIPSHPQKDASSVESRAQVHRRRTPSLVLNARISKTARKEKVAVPP